MHQAGVSVHADMDFHAKVPLVVFLGVMYLWIAFTEAIFGGTRAATNVATAYLAKDKRQDYGERRFRVLGCIGGRVVRQRIYAAR